MILADSDVGAMVADWLNTAGVVGLLAVILTLWLRGYLVRGVDMDRAVALAEDRHTKEMKALRERFDAVKADRDAWRQAHKDEAAARREAERAAHEGAGRDELALGLLSAIRELVVPHD